ncbi:MAG: MarR family winged helix-turn-helix transcriptional regulator [Bacteroidota bacterium]
MQPSLHLIQELLPLLDEYQATQTATHTDLQSFVLWLNKKVLNPAGQLPHEGQTLDSRILAGIWRMSKFARHYARMALQDSPLKGIDDFVMLVALLEVDSYTKSELILHTLTDFQTGIGIMKRLAKLGLLEELEDPDDKRSKRVRLSQQGRGVLFSLFVQMQQVSEIVGADLNENEKVELLTVLKHLDNIHLKVYQDKELDQLESIHTTMLNETEGV